MKASKFNLGWRVKEGITQPFDALLAGSNPGEPVTLPQDAMIQEARRPDCPSQCQNGFYPAKSYTYTKEFDVPTNWAEQQTLIEFEGVMAHAQVYLNNQFLGCHHYGYSSFTVNPQPYLRFGQKNILKVIAANQELSSRWYPGSGIYRDVILWQGGKSYFVPDGVRVTTLSVTGDSARIAAEFEISHEESADTEGTVCVEVMDDDQVLGSVDVPCCLAPGKPARGHCEWVMPQVHLWSPENPYLYTIRLTLRHKDGAVCDIHTETTGFRTLTLSSSAGLCLNGQTVKLRGACIHHDNGVIGATTLEAAEAFRLNKLKEGASTASAVPITPHPRPC